MCQETEELYNRARHEASREWQRKQQEPQRAPFMERMRQIIYDALRDENDKHYALDGPEVNLAIEKIVASIEAEDIKHWYQLLVGYDEARMKDDMMYGDWRQDEMDFANNGQYKRV